MEPPQPKPRKLNVAEVKTPVPLPRSKNVTVPSAEASSCSQSKKSSQVLRSIESLSKQLTEDIANKVQDGGRYVKESSISAINKLDRSISQGKLAKQRFEQSVRSSTRSAREKVSRSVAETKHSAGVKLSIASKHFNRSKNHTLTVPSEDRCVSMPEVDTELFDTIQFNSPINEQNQFNNLDLSGSARSLSINSFPSVITSEGKEEGSSGYSLCSDSPSNAEEVYDLPRSTSSVNNSLYDMACNTSSAVQSTEAGEDVDKVEVRVKLEDATDELRSQSVVHDFDTLIPSIVVPKVVERKNSCSGYENVQIIRKPAERKRPSKSVINVFDPLSQSTDVSVCTKMTELSLLESLLAGDTYGERRGNEDSYETSSDGSDVDMYWDISDTLASPPTPPERSDSLFNNTDAPNEVKENNETSKKQTQWFVSENNVKSDDNVQLRNEGSPGPSEISKDSNVTVRERLSNIWKLVPASNLKKKIGHGFDSQINVPEKLISSQFKSYYRGTMTHFVVKGIDEVLKNSQLRLCILSDHKLLCYTDNNTNSTSKEIYNLKHLFSIQMFFNQKKLGDEELFCFQLNISGFGGFKLSHGSILFGCKTKEDRLTWTQKIIESFNVTFPTEYIQDLSRFGWCYLKEGVNNSWIPAWLMLRKRMLHYYTASDKTIKYLDLRKARCIVLQDSEKKGTPGENGLNILIDLPSVTIYLRMGANKETKFWYGSIKRIASNNGKCLHHQQLTKDDVPTLVDKCINFIYIQGSLSEGIYRKAGSLSAVKTILANFHNDAWAVQLSRDDFSEYDVATALKRFFRDLPEPVLSTDLHSSLCAASELPEEEKVPVYRRLLGTLDEVSKNTLKKLLGHLHFIHSLRNENLMNAANLASVWGPTLMQCPVSADTNDMSWSRKEADVVKDLIEFYLPIYQPSIKDLECEKKMLMVLRRYYENSAPIPSKPSGDLRVWIYLFDKSSGDCLNILLKPDRTSGDICTELSSKVQREPHELLIEEVICEESLQRPLHHTELLLDVVLRWGYWDESDRKDNYLILKDNNFLQRVARFSESFPSTNLSGEFKFANEKTKAVKQQWCELNEANIIILKEKTATTSLGSWPLKDIRWYIGFEHKRNPQTLWSITFIDKKNKAVRTKEKPWFGCTISGSTTEDELRWICLLIRAEYSGTILPVPQLIVTA